MNLTPELASFLENMAKHKKFNQGMYKYLDENNVPQGKFSNFLQGERYNPNSSYTTIDKNSSPLEQLERQALAEKEQREARNDKFNKAEKGVGIFSDVGKGALSLGQIFKSLAVKRGLHEPKAPQAPLESHLLNTQIAKALSDADNIDPRYNTQAQRNAALTYAKDDARARNFSAGNSSLFQALSQINGIKANDALRKSNLAVEGMKNAKNARADELIGRKLYEDMAKYDRARKDYRDINYPEFLSRRKYGGQLSSQGLTNLFAMLDSLTGNKKEEETKS